MLALGAALSGCSNDSAESCGTTFGAVYFPAGVSPCPVSVTEGCCIPADQLGALLDAGPTDAADENPG